MFITKKIAESLMLDLISYYSILCVIKLWLSGDYYQSNIKGLLYRFNNVFSVRSQPCDQAKLFTVKVKQGEGWGSGFILNKQGVKYTVVTNGHVLTTQNKYKIETYNKKEYTAIVLHRFDKDKLKGDDVAVLQFDSYDDYPVAKLESLVKIGQKVVASGFPLETSPDRPLGFFCTELSELSFTLAKPMEEGYQLGYFSSLPNGMSGGPLLNSDGKVVGINGKTDPTIFINPNLYRYKDGSLVNESLDLLSSSSWAIPTKTIVNLTSKFINLNNTLASPKPIIQNRELVSLEDKLRKSTVVISDYNPSNSKLPVNSFSSGVIFAKEGKNYYVLSINHQVSKQSKYGIFDGNLQEKYPATIIKTYPHLGLSILRFTSEYEYNIANFGSLKPLQANVNVKLAGWSGTQANNFYLVDGKINNIQSFIPDSKFSHSDKMNHVMLGSGVFSNTGELLSIYTKYSQENNQMYFIPMNLFVKIAPWNIQKILSK
jgi:S1-C subfamily serine protease